MTINHSRLAKLVFTAGVGVFALGSAFVAGLFAAAETMADVLDFDSGPDDDDPAAMGRRQFPDAA